MTREGLRFVKRNVSTDTCRTYHLEQIFHETRSTLWSTQNGFIFLTHEFRDHKATTTEPTLLINAFRGVVPSFAVLFNLVIRVIWVPLKPHGLKLGRFQIKHKLNTVSVLLTFSAAVSVGSNKLDSHITRVAYSLPIKNIKGFLVSIFLTISKMISISKLSLNSFGSCSETYLSHRYPNSFGTFVGTYRHELGCNLADRCISWRGCER